MLITKMLLQQDALNVNHLNKNNESALLLRLRGADTRPEFSSPCEELDVVKLFLSRGADPNVPAHLLAWAINFCSLDVCRELLQHGADPNSTFPDVDGRAQESALHCALKLN